MKKIFLDTEFTGLHKLTTLISVALVCEDGNEYYAELTDYDENQVTPFITKEVINKLFIKDFDLYRDYNPEAKSVTVQGNLDLVKQTLTDWLHKYKDEGVEIWVESPAYCWGLFVDIFGGVGYLPKQMGKVPYDLFTAYKLYGFDPQADKKTFLPDYDNLITFGENNSLNDARINMQIYKKLLDVEVRPVEDEDVVGTEEPIENEK